VILKDLFKSEDQRKGKKNRLGKKIRTGLELDSTIALARRLAPLSECFFVLSKSKYINYRGREDRDRERQ
jgi:hypothetical protein